MSSLAGVCGPILNSVTHFYIATFKSSLYNLDNTPLSNMSFANILHVCGGFFHCIDEELLNRVTNDLTLSILFLLQIMLLATA